MFFIVIFPNVGVWDFSMANVDRDMIWFFIRWARMAIRWSRSRVMCMLHAHSRGQLGKEWKYKVTFVFVFCLFLFLMERKMRIAWLMSECVQKEIGVFKVQTVQSGRNPNKAEQVKQSMTFLPSLVRESIAFSPISPFIFIFFGSES